MAWRARSTQREEQPRGRSPNGGQIVLPQAGQAEARERLHRERRQRGTEESDGFLAFPFRPPMLGADELAPSR